MTGFVASWKNVVTKSVVPGFVDSWTSVVTKSVVTGFVASSFILL